MSHFYIFHRKTRERRRGAKKSGPKPGKCTHSLFRNAFSLFWDTLWCQVSTKGACSDHISYALECKESQEVEESLSQWRRSHSNSWDRVRFPDFGREKNIPSRESPEKHSTVYVRTFLGRIIALSSRGLITKQFRGCFTPLKIASSDLQHQFNTNHRFRRTHYGSICIAIFVMSLLEPRCDPVIRTNLTRVSGTKRDG